jgi:hypothetical protein
MSINLRKNCYSDGGHRIFRWQLSSEITSACCSCDSPERTLETLVAGDAVEPPTPVFSMRSTKYCRFEAHSLHNILAKHGNIHDVRIIGRKSDCLRPVLRSR